MPFTDLPENILNGDAGPRSSWIVGAYTGYKIHQQGTHSTLGMVNTALGWRIWTAVMLWWAGVWAVGTAIFIWAGLAWQTMPVAIATIVIHAVVIYVAMGLAFIRLTAQSQFNLRGPFRPLWPVALRVPNLAPLWLYLLPLAPVVWTLTASKFMVLWAAA